MALSQDSNALVRAGIWLALLALFAFFLLKIQVTLTIFATAWLIAYLARPLVARLEGRRLGPIAHCPRGLAVTVLYLLLFSLLGLGVSLVLPHITGQFNRLLGLQAALAHPEVLTNNLQVTGERLLQHVPEQYRASLLLKLRQQAPAIASHLGSYVTTALAYLASFLTQLAAGAAIFLSALLVSIYLMMGWESLYLGTLGVVPRRYRAEFASLLAEMNTIFGGYVRATIITSAVTGGLTLVALWALASFTGRPDPYVIVIGLIATLTYPIPLFGVMVATFAGMVFGFMAEGDFVTGLQVAATVFTVNIIIDRTLQPKLMGDAIGVSALFVIFAAGAGGEFLGGIWGMLLGIPLAAMAKAFFLWFHRLFLRQEAADAQKSQPVVLLPESTV